MSLSTDLSSFKSCFNLGDAWRSKHPRVSQCTRFNANLSIGSRLDSLLVCREVATSLSSCEISPCVFPDHEFVILDVDLSHVFDFGLGVWKFNNSLLEDRIYCDLIIELINQHLSFRHVFVSVKDFWESLKDVIRSRTIEFSKAKRMRSRYFFKLGRERFDRNYGSSILNSDEAEVSDRAALISAHESFYANLFSREEIDLVMQEALFLNLSLRLSEEDCDRCEGLRLLSEITSALGNMSKKKSPGPHGLSVEFYS